MGAYKALTPQLRLDIQIAIDKEIRELQACTPNVLVKMQIEAWEVEKRLINGLPDGFPIPLKDVE